MKVNAEIFCTDRGEDSGGGRSRWQVGEPSAERMRMMKVMLKPPAAASPEVFTSY